MAIPNGATTGTAQIGALVQTAYDQYVRMALRDIPVMRSIADVKPVQQAMPGSSVVFSIYSDLAQATSTLTESTDVSSIALGNPTQVSVTLNEYGSAVTTTKKLNLTSFNDVDSALADIIAYNAADSIDKIVANTLSTGQNSIIAPNVGTPAAPVQGNMTVDLMRQAVVNLRTNKALPRIGELYAAYLHPRQSADLRAEVGTGGFQELTKYVERTPFTAGSIGVIEGAYVVETPRVLFGTNVNGQIVTPVNNANVNYIAASGASASYIELPGTVTAPSIGDTITLTGMVANSSKNGVPFTVTDVSNAGPSWYVFVGGGATWVEEIPTMEATIITMSWPASGGSYYAIVAGREALAEAQAQNVSTVIGPEIDALRRFRTIGWYYFGGFARLREAALYNIQTGSSY